MAEEIHMINGSKTSGHKPNYDLLTPSFLKRAAQRMTDGLHYGRDNWKKGAETKEYTLDRLNHAFEHLIKATAKIANDEPIGDDDLAAVVVNCMFAMYYQEWARGYDTQREAGFIAFGTDQGTTFATSPAVKAAIEEAEKLGVNYICKNCGVQFSHTPLKITTIPPLANYNGKPTEFYFHNVECQTTWLRNPKY